MANGLSDATFLPFMPLGQWGKRAYHLWAGSFHLAVPLAISTVGGNVCVLVAVLSLIELGKIRWTDYPLSQLLTGDSQRIKFIQDCIFMDNMLL